MTHWLMVTLKAPMASFGEAPGNAERGTADRPTRSALLGLAGAALGIHRTDAEGQSALRRSFRIATLTRKAGSLLTDFHTYQSLPSSKGRPQTRAEALAQREDLATSITRREYRCDVWFEAAYTCQPDAPFSLEALATAFRKPHFMLWLGRKSCPLSEPLNPTILEMPDVRQAFWHRLKTIQSQNTQLQTIQREGVGQKPSNPAEAWKGLIAVEERADFGSETLRIRSHHRLDEPGDRRAWHFTARREYIMPITSQEDASS